MGVMIRAWRADDAPHALRVAAAGGSPDSDPAYFAFVARVGRLLVAVDDLDGVIGVAGAIAVGRSTMVTDLFVDEEHRGGGLGRRLVGAVTDGAWRRFTFSSLHPAAPPTYVGAGMTPRWQLLTMRGHGLGPAGGGVESESARAALAAPWAHDRPELVEHLSAGGAEVGAHHLLTRRTDLVSVHRLVDPESERLEHLLQSVPEDVPVELSLAEHDSFVPWLGARGFEVADFDLCCASDGVEFDVAVRCVHRGLC